MRKIYSLEHLLGHFVFILVNIWLIKHKKYATITSIKKWLIWIFASIVSIIYISINQRNKGWISARVLSIIIPNLKNRGSPIIESVAEHKAPPWTVFFSEYHSLLLFIPIGLSVCFKSLTKPKLFIALYFVVTTYFSAIMVRIMLIQTIAITVLAGMGLSYLLKSVI